MYGDKSSKIENRLNELEEMGATDTAEYKNLVEKYGKVRKKELKTFNQNWRENSKNKKTFL